MPSHQSNDTYTMLRSEILFRFEKQNTCIHYSIILTTVVLGGILTIAKAGFSASSYSYFNIGFLLYTFLQGTIATNYMYHTWQFLAQIQFMGTLPPAEWERKSYHFIWEPFSPFWRFFLQRFHALPIYAAIVIGLCGMLFSLYKIIVAWPTIVTEFDGIILIVMNAVVVFSVLFIVEMHHIIHAKALKGDLKKCIER